MLRYEVDLYNEDGDIDASLELSAGGDREACYIVLNEIVIDRDAAGWRMYRGGCEIKPLDTDYA